MKWHYTAARSTQPELMDSEPVSFKEFQHCLRDLERINHATIAYRPTLQWLRGVLRQWPNGRKVSLFDIGSGGGDMLRRIAGLFAGKRLQLTGIDLNPWSKAAADALTPRALPIIHETANIFDLDPARKADLIISSLFTHHLTDPELLRFIGWMEDHAKVGWFINDLHRHWLPYHFIKFAVRTLRLNRLVIHDAPVSVARSFRRRDWRQLLQHAGLDGKAEIRWYFPFRYCVSRIKTNA